MNVYYDAAKLIYRLANGHEADDVTIVNALLGQEPETDPNLFRHAVVQLAGRFMPGWITYDQAMAVIKMAANFARATGGLRSFLPRPDSNYVQTEDPLIWGDE